MNEDAQRLQDCLTLLNTCKTLQLATVDTQGWPHISYAPFVRQNEHFYIFLSQLAKHTQHLQQMPKASVMVIKDEADSRNLFARERLIIDVHVEKAELAAARSNTHNNTNSILDQMEAELGNTVGLLRTLPDFVLFRLTAAQARYIAGFGKAYDLDLKRESLVHLSAEKLAEGSGINTVALKKVENGQ
jgi:putative heme iron utilization protein